MPRIPASHVSASGPSASHGLATARTGLPARGAPFGPAQSTGQQRSKDGLLQLLIQRELLMADARHLKNNRRSKAASRCEAELRRVTQKIMKLTMEMHGEH